MKKQLVTVLTMFGFLSIIVLVTAVGSAPGQSFAYRLRANIPFDFVVGDKKFSAGEYSIGRAHQHSGDNLLWISSADGRSNAFRLSTPVVSRLRKNSGALVFHRYEDQYFLSQVWPAGASTGRELPKSRRERELVAKLKMAQKVQAVEIVNIVTDGQ